jgi:spore germination protein KB
MIKDGKIGYKGWLGIVILNETVKVFDASFHILFKDNNQAGWLSGIVGGLFNLLFVFGVLRFMHPFPNRGFLEVLQIKVGKWASNIYAINAFFLLVGAGSIHARLCMDEIKIITMPNTPFSVLSGLILGLAILIVIKGIEPISRVITLLMPYLVVMLISLVILLYEHYNFTNLFPLFGPGIKQLAFNGIQRSLYFGEPLALCIFAGFVREQRSFEKGLWRGAIYSFIIICSIAVFFQVAMGTPTTSEISFPFIEMTRLIYVNRFIQHLEGFYATIWLFLDLTAMALNLYLSTLIFTMFFSIPNYRPIVWGIASLYFLLILIPAFFYQTLTIELTLIKWGGLITYGLLFIFALATKTKKILFSS